jgi:CubicO group peptidase (beta-lactamase class C family)
MSKSIAFIAFLILTIRLSSQNAKKYADSLLLSNHIPEIGYAVITADSIIEIQTLGYHQSDLKNDSTKAKPDDYFHLGSNSKAITGFIAAYLVELNKIKWTTKFFDLFPSWKKQSDPAYFEITLADLLSHRARIQPYTSGLEYGELPDFTGDKQEQRKQFAKYLLAEKPVRENGKAYNYSNGGYSIAALMLEKVSGQSWEQLTVGIFASKLQLDIRFGWPTNFNTNQPSGHWIENHVLKPVPIKTDYNLAMAEPAGDISMTLPAYAKFIQYNLLGLTGRDNILKASTYEYLHYGFKDYAIGWGNINSAIEQVSEHSGSAGTFFVYTIIDKKKKIAYIIAANAAGEEVQQGLYRLLDFLRKKYEL